MTLIKDPDARLDYTWDWTAWLADGDTIATATITRTDGVTAGPPEHTDTHVVAWLDGGTPGTIANVTVKITTAQGRIDERTLHLRIEDR